MTGAVVALRWMFTLGLFGWLWVAGTSWAVLMAVAVLVLRSEVANALLVQRWRDDVRLAEAIRSLSVATATAQGQTATQIAQLQLAILHLPAHKH